MKLESLEDLKALKKWENKYMTSTSYNRMTLSKVAMVYPLLSENTEKSWTDSTSSSTDGPAIRHHAITTPFICISAMQMVSWVSGICLRFSTSAKLRSRRPFWSTICNFIPIEARKLTCPAMLTWWKKELWQLTPNHTRKSTHTSSESF